MERIRQTTGLAFLLAACIALPSLGATVTINQSLRYQTIEGFGGSIAHEMWGLQSYDSSYYNQIVKDLGVSLVRLFLQPDFEPSSGTFNTTSGAAGVLLGICRKLSAAGLQRVAPTVFSPPGWMKQGPFNASCSDGTSMCGGTLAPAMYDAFAEYYVRYIRAIEQCGVQVYAVSPENEPAWAQGYVSCVYSFAQMHDVVVRLGQRFAAESMPVKIFSAEDLFSNTWSMYARAILADSTAKHFGDVIAVHDPATPPTPTIISRYRSARQVLEGYAPLAGKAPYSIGLWNSEVHATAIDASAANPWGDALDLSRSMVVSLRDAKMTGWLMGSVTVPAGNSGSESIMLQRQPAPRYYACKQFFRYIRPGAVMVDAASDDSTVMAVAFVHAADRTMTIVLVNAASAARSVTLQGSGLPVFTQVRSSQSETCDTVGSVTGSLTLPASSITTLFATGFVTSVAAPTAARCSRTQPSHGTALFTLDGRRTLGRCAGVYLATDGSLTRKAFRKQFQPGGVR